MGKRKELGDQQMHNSILPESSSEESSSEDDTNILDVEFEWFDPQPEHDFHGLKTLLRQLFDADAQLFDLSALTDLVLSQPLLGSTVKVDGNETDPYAFLTIVNLHEHSDKPVIQQLTNYVKTQSLRSTALAQIDSLLTATSEAQVGLILTERLINIPSEVVPPMYKMLVEEISWAIDEDEPYNFTHYLIFSKLYREVPSTVDDENAPKSKKQKKSATKDFSRPFYFHPEDEVLQKHSTVFGDFEYQKESGESDSKRTFRELGIKPGGHLILIEAAKFKAAVEGIHEFFKQT